MNIGLAQIVLLFALILLGIWIFKNVEKKGIEGFEQKERFLLKTDKDIYDDFYCEIYDELMERKRFAAYELDQIIKTLQPEPRFATFLDIGSGTGSAVHLLKEIGYKAYGIDQSQSMVELSQRKHSGLEIKCADIEDPMAYDRALFTHILCLDFTLYEIEDKTRFFNNCHFWLQHNGYLVIHLAERGKFNAITPAAKPSDVILSGERILKTNIDFDGFVYVSEYVALDGSKMVHKENFTDKTTQHIRENERTLHMESSAEILEIARISGFVAKGAFTLEWGPSKDKWQQVVILERI
jgi:SAM-dependent methyltransferase